jgi:branched-chain amino acid transport system substrate-binding protein
MKRLCFLIFISLNLISCSKKEEELKIGAIFPLTGQAAGFGKNAQMGINLALTELGNKFNNNKNVKIIYEDTQGSPKNAVSAIEKLINIDKVNLCFILTSGETLAIIPIINKNSLITFTGTVLPNITDKSTFLYRNASSLDNETKYMANFLSKTQNNPKVSILYINNEAGTVANNMFIEQYKAQGGNVIASLSYDPSVKDFKTFLLKIKENEPDYLYILSYNEFGLIMRQARELGLKSVFLGTTTFNDISGINLAGDAANGTLFTTSAFNNEKGDSPIVYTYKKKFHETYGIEPELYSAIFYDNIYILKKVYEKNPKTPEEFKKSIIELGTYAGVSGNTRFLLSGDVEKEVIIKKIENSEIVEYE